MIYLSPGFLHKHIKTPDHQEAIRSCSRYKFIDTCENIQSLITQLTIDHYLIWKLKHQNLDSFSHLLLFLSGDISLNPSFVLQDTMQCWNEWNIFKNRGLHFIHLNINSFLSKLEEFHYRYHKPWKTDSYWQLNLVGADFLDTQIQVRRVYYDFR